MIETFGAKADTDSAGTVRGGGFDERDQSSVRLLPDFSVVDGFGVGALEGDYSASTSPESRMTLTPAFFQE